MRTSLNEIQEIEKYIHHQLPTEDNLLFEAKTIINPSLRQNLFLQKKMHEILRLYHRAKLKNEMDRIHHRVFHKPENASFRKNILQLFNSNL